MSDKCDVSLHVQVGISILRVFNDGTKSPMSGRYDISMLYLAEVGNQFLIQNDLFSPIVNGIQLEAKDGHKKSEIFYPILFG